MSSSSRPRILIVTPEITYLPSGMGNYAQRMSAKAGGLADVSASLVSALFELGADVHVALPNYRRMFQGDVFNFHEKQLRMYYEVLPDAHIHLAEDRIFYYREQVYSGYQDESMKIAMVFQREVINHIIPNARPDLIHCNDWMTGLIPGMARRRGIKSLFTVHNIHTQRVRLPQIEDNGIDAAEFWANLYYDGMPYNYEHARNATPVDLLTSGIFAAHFINTVSPRFLWEIVEGWHPMVPESRDRSFHPPPVPLHQCHRGQAPKQTRPAARVAIGGKPERATVLLAFTPRSRAKRPATALGHPAQTRVRLLA
jgi:starch synthase